MSHISEKVMRGKYLSKQECFEHAEEIERVMNAYGPAMAAMEEHERLMADCTCSFDLDIHDRVARQHSTDCPVHHRCANCNGTNVEMREDRDDSAGYHSGELYCLDCEGSAE